MSCVSGALSTEDPASAAVSAGAAAAPSGVTLFAIVSSSARRVVLAAVTLRMLAPAAAMALEDADLLEKEADEAFQGADQAYKQKVFSKKNSHDSRLSRRAGSTYDVKKEAK